MNKQEKGEQEGMKERGQMCGMSGCSVVVGAKVVHNFKRLLPQVAICVIKTKRSAS
jgi:hypothetical protein